jgi:hypothetical protein
MWIVKNLWIQLAKMSCELRERLHNGQITVGLVLQMRGLPKDFVHTNKAIACLFLHGNTLWAIAWK